MRATCPFMEQRQPNAVRIRHAEKTSVRRGQFSSTVSPRQSSEAARIGNTLFFAPCSVTVPSSGMPPVITSFCIRTTSSSFFSWYANAYHLVRIRSYSDFGSVFGSSFLVSAESVSVESSADACNGFPAFSIKVSTTR